MNQVVKEFIVYSLKEISLLKNVKVSSYPKIILTQDDNKTETLAYFNPNNSEIVVYSKGRIYADIFRSIVHELVHYVQMKNNELTFNSGDTGTDVENEANSIAGIVLRNYTKLHPEIIKQSYSTIEPKNEIPTLQGMVEVNPPIANLLNIYKASVDNIKSVIKQDSYDGCLMLQLDIPNWEILLQQIDENDLYIDSESEHIQGLEHEPHATVLYGLSNKIDKLKLINSIKTIQNEIKVNLTEVNLFENEKFDVVKFKVDSPVLHKLHSFVKENFDNNESYPTYEPHVTIAYVKKGCGSKYIKQLDQPLIYSSKTFKYSGGNDSILLECDCEENLEDKLNEGSVKSSERVNIYRDSRYTIVSPLSHKASCKYGANSKWCTSTPSSSHMYDKSLLSNKKFIIIIDKQPIKKYTDDEIEKFEDLALDGDKFSQLFVRIYEAILYDTDADLQSNEMEEGLSIIKKLLDFSKLNIRFESNKYSIWTADNFNIRSMFGVKLSQLGLPNQALSNIKEYMMSFDKKQDLQQENLEDDEIEGLLEYLKTAKDFINEAEYQGRKVTLNKPMRGDVKKFKVYVKNSKGKVVKVNFGSKDYNIKKNNPNRKKSYCSRSKGIKGGGTDKTKANYWSRRQWKC